MNTSKIIKGVVGGGRYTVTAPIIKEDYGLYLQIEGIELPETYEVDFSNDEHSGSSVTMIGNSDGVLIPSQFIKSGKDVFAFLYHVGDNYGRTVFKFRIPNKLRPDRTNEEPTPEEQSTIDQAINALNTAVAKTAQDVVDADESARSAAESADRADEAKTSAETAQRKSEEAQESSERAKDDAETSERNASESERKAKGYAETASEKADSIHSMTASAQTLPAGSSASASYNAQTGVMSFGIPKGDKGDKGDRGEQGIQGIQGERGLTGAKGDKGDKGDTGAQGIQGIQGEKGEQGIQGEKGEKGDKGDKGDTGEVTTEEFLKAFVTDSASGSIASFTDGADNLPLKSLVVNIDPVQDLSQGDPSPENICPISGWTGCEVNHSGADTSDPTTIHITFPTEAGTVYGGKLDVLSGVLTVDRAMVDMGTLTWTYNATGNAFHATIPTSLVGSTNYICTIYKNGGIFGGVSVLANKDDYAIYRQSTNTNFFVKDSRYADAATFKSAMDGVQLVYELATPIEIQLSPNQVSSLLGANNIWADTGDSSVEYRADTGLYIKRLTQPEEDDMIADSAIASGQFFMIGNTLYRALASIASGATITVGTNAERVSLSDALNLVNA